MSLRSQIIKYGMLKWEEAYNGSHSNHERSEAFSKDAENMLESIIGDYEPVKLTKLTDDNMPKSHTEVWVCSSGNVFIATRWESQGWKNRDGYSIVTPTHWAPIHKPSPPE